MANIGIIGSGNVGANTAFFLAEKAVGNVLLYDVQEGLAKGKALDMMEAAPVRGYKTTISGTEDRNDVFECDVVIVSAGAVRTPGMKREDLYQSNRDMIVEYAHAMKGSGAKVIMVTEPVDLLTALFVRESGMKREQVLGLGGLLDSTRLRYMVAHELGVTMENVTANVIGRHAPGMIPLAKYTTVSGVPVDRLIAPERLSELFERTRNAGDVIVDMAQRANAYYGPSASAADLAEAIRRDTGRIMPISLVLNGEFGVKGVAMSLPAVIGRNGVEQVLKPQLTDEQLKQFTTSASELEQILGK